MVSALTLETRDAGVETLVKFLHTNCLCFPAINWVPGHQMIGNSLSGEHGGVVAWWIMFHTLICLVTVHCPHISAASLSKGWGGLEGHIGLPAQEPVLCPSRSCMGMETLYIRIPGL